MTLFGAPDFQSQVAPTFTLLGQVNINGAGHVVVDVGPQVLPYHQGLLLAWVASPASVGSPIFASVTLSLSSLPIMQGTNIADGASIVAPLPGALVTGTAGVQCNVDISPSPLGVSPVTGSLFVFALTTPPTVIPTVRRASIGLGFTSDSVAVGVGATVTVLPAPVAGTYWRVKYFSWIWSAAPAANVSVLVRRLSDLANLTQWRSTAAQTDGRQLQMDFELFDGIVVTNNAGVAGNATIIAERWQI